MMQCYFALLHVAYLLQNDDELMTQNVPNANKQTYSFRVSSDTGLKPRHVLNQLDDYDGKQAYNKSFVRITMFWHFLFWRFLNRNVKSRWAFSYLAVHTRQQSKRFPFFLIM